MINPEMCTLPPYPSLNKTALLEEKEKALLAICKQ
jgi:hypothetical protein